MKPIHINIQPTKLKANINTKGDKATLNLDSNVVYSPIDASFINNQNLRESIFKNGRYEYTYNRLEYTGLDNVVIDVSVETPTQVKSVVYESNGLYQVTPDASYHLSKVNIDVSIDTDYYYDKGVEDGIEQGIETQKSKITPITIHSNGVYEYEHGYNPVEVAVPIPTYSSQEKNVTITENKQTIVTPDVYYDGLSQVTITTAIPIPTYSSQQKSVVINNNGTSVILPDASYDGLSRVDLSINVPSDEPTPTQSKTVVYNQNGQYTILPDEGYALDRVDASVCIDTSSFYEEGKQQGIEEQKAKLVSLSVTQNGHYSRSDGYSSVDVSVESTPPVPTQTKSVVYDTNGEYSVTPDTGYTLSAIDISINVPSSPGGSLQAKTTDASTEQVIVLPDASYYGLSQVTVNAVDASIDPNIVPENIKAGVTILGVDGSLTSINGRLQDKTVDSSTLTQVVTFTSPDYTGLNTVTINPYILESKIVDSSTGSQTIFPGPNYNGIGQLTINPYVLDTKTVDASTNQLVITSDTSALSSVTINAVDASIDDNIIPENIKAGVNILGVTGILVDDIQIDLQDKTVTPSDVRIEVTADSSYDGLGTVYVQAAPTYEATLDASTVSQSFVPIAGYVGFSRVIVNSYSVESATVDSSTGSQTILPSSADALSQVTVNPYTVHSKTVNPTTSQQVITPDSSYDALSQVTINAVDASIDPNIQPQNIINGVTILGVTGTYTSHTVSAGYEEIYRRLMNL